MDVKIGKIRRAINCIVVDNLDENVYCGTTSGDIIHARSFKTFSFRFQSFDQIALDRIQSHTVYVGYI